MASLLTSPLQSPEFVDKNAGYARAVAHVSAAVRAADRLEVQRALLRHASALECLALGAPAAVDAQQALHVLASVELAGPRRARNRWSSRGDSTRPTPTKHAHTNRTSTASRACG